MFNAKIFGTKIILTHYAVTCRESHKLCEKGEKTSTKISKYDRKLFKERKTARKTSVNFC